MHKLFYPKVIVDSIYHIDLDKLLQDNIMGLIIDIDNTLVGHGVLEADDRVVQWIENARKIGIKMCIASNNREQRVVKFNERLQLPAIYKAAKPFKRAFLRAAELMELPTNKVAVIGDQIFTDILGGNRLGMYTIMVKPVNSEEPYSIKLKRYIEKLILKNMKSR